MKTHNLSQGNPAKVLILFALPMIISVTLQQIYNIADSAIAGQFVGNGALSAVSVSYPITMVYLSVATGLGIGVGVITSRLFGAKNYTKTKTAITTALIFSLALAAFMSLLGILITKPCLYLIDTPEDILEDSATYLRFYCGGLIFTYLYNVVTCIYQSLGNSKTPLYFLIFSTILNILLDLLFVAVFSFGVLGLALGTFIAQGVAMLASLIFLLLNVRRSLKSEEESKLFDFNLLKEMLSIAIPSIIQGATIAIGQFFVQKRVNYYGSEFIAGYGAAYKLCYIAVNIFTAYSNAISNYTAQNIGAGQQQRIIEGFKWSLLICLMFALVIGGILCIFPEALLKIFMNSNASKDAFIYGSDFIYIVAPFFIFMGIKIPSDGVLKGSKDMASFMVGTFLDLILRILLAYILSIYTPLGYKGIFIAWPIGWFFGMAVSSAMFFQGRWKKLAFFNKE